MASDYGLNFGFRRSDESSRVSEGRVRTPKTGAALLLGTCVTIDAAAPGYLKVAAAAAPPVTGVTGLLLQEEIWDRSIYQSDRVDSFVLGVALKDRLSVITNGAGTKVWFKNTLAQTRADGRVIPAVTLVDLTGAVVGGGLSWNGTTWVASAAGDAATHMVITDLDAAKGYVEAVLVA